MTGGGFVGGKGIFEGTLVMELAGGVMGICGMMCARE